MVFIAMAMLGTVQVVLAQEAQDSRKAPQARPEQHAAPAAHAKTQPRQDAQARIRAAQAAADRAKRGSHSNTAHSNPATTHTSSNRMNHRAADVTNNTGHTPPNHRRQSPPTLQPPHVLGAKGRQPYPTRRLQNPTPIKTDPRLAEARKRQPAPQTWNQTYRPDPDRGDRRPAPPRPTTFNFFHRGNWRSDHRYDNAPVYIEQPTIVTGITFFASVPLVSGFRIGFVQYSTGFRDTSFAYRRYCYWPYDRCVVSPWYYYPQLPAYLPTEVVYVQPPVEYVTDYDPYYWVRGRDTTPLDLAVDGIEDAFEARSAGAMMPYVPGDGQIAIFLDGAYRYSVRTDDFRDMMYDTCSKVKTSQYRIDEVRRYHDGSAMVLARHITLDPWGNRETVYHRYRLEPLNGRYVIREFGTSQRRI